MIKKRKLLEYVCHEFTRGRTATATEIARNRQHIREICCQVWNRGHGNVPVAPQLDIDQWIGPDATDEEIMAVCLPRLRACDVIGVYGGKPSPGMMTEIEFASAHGIPVKIGG